MIFAISTILCCQFLYYTTKYVVIYIYILLYFLLELPTYQSVDQEFKRIVFGWLHLIIVLEIPSISTNLVA